MRLNEKYSPPQRSPEGGLYDKSTHSKSPFGGPLGGRAYRIILCSSLACLLFCSHEYNPFTDFNNAGVFVGHSSMKNLDTVRIFSTETLQVSVAVKELVDSFSVFAAANRLWTSPESTISAQAFANEPFTFLVSFHDTGMQSIIMTTFRKNSKHCEESLTVYCASPLYQAPISAIALDSVVLRTPCVRDRDVTYCWSFGAGTSFISPMCSTKVSLSAPVLAGKGTLWVWDGRFTSPVDSFSFSLGDTICPAITCANDNSSISGDTVYTSDSVFTFRASITDNFSGTVDSASVNGVPFDGKNGSVYYKLFDRVYTHPPAAPLLLSVYALDHFQNGNAARRNFWLVFSTTVPHAKKINIVILSPAHDSSVVTTPVFLCAGRVDNLSLDSLDLTLHASVNGISDPAVQAIGGAKVSWEWNLSLTTGEDTVQIIGTDNKDGSVLDLKEFILFYTPDAPDTVPPLILSVTADGMPAQGLFTAAASVVLGVKAFDQGSGIDSLFINGAVCQPSAGFWYYDTVALLHRVQGNQIPVTAVDKKKNAVHQTVIIYRNNPPIIQTWPKSSFIPADSAYSDTIAAFDPDNDTLTYQRTAGPAGLTVSQKGIITWTPAKTDTGTHAVTIRVWDGYQPVFATYTLFVSLPGQGPPKPVSFATREADFPQFLIAGRDSLFEVLRIKAGTGIPPFAFSCRIIGKRAPLLDNNSDSLISWLPTLADTGYCQFIVVVKDQFPSTDTLYPRVLVVPPVRPCSIAVAFHTPAESMANGAINLNTLRQQFRLVFRIFDPNNPLVERHDVALFESRTHTTSSFDSAVVDTFGLTIDPTALSGYDTIMATVRDASSSDTLKVMLYYGSPPSTPVAVFPLDFAQVNQSTVSLRYACSDPDNDTLAYDVYAGSNPLSLSLVGSTGDTSLALFGLAPSTVYYWKVVARDLKSQTSSQLWQFSTGAF
jgi:Putative Ig domain